MIYLTVDIGVVIIDKNGSLVWGMNVITFYTKSGGSIASLESLPWV